uniref:Uncharacterized protein n=1 Tax=Globisporangium ultimum (strain ATCC 200006 / CBS 805.95 / DAOM BR144) TaxID=431595 RepID=K3W8K1_GLOUD
MVIFDSVSLQDPRTGWKANVTFWVRFFVGGLFVGGTILLHARLVISELSLTSKQIVVIVLTSALGYTALLMLLAETWMFPVPFTYTIGGMFFMLILSTLVMLTLGRTNQEQLVKIFNFTKSLSVQALMALMYPAYNATFLALDGDGQLAFVLLLPPMKMSLKYLTAKMNPIDDDFMPAMMSSVDIFDAMYMTKCMQSASSLKVGCAIILIDFLQNYWAIWRLEKRTQALQSAWVNCDDGARNQASGTLLPFVFQVIRQTDRLNSSVLRFGSTRIAVSEETRKELSHVNLIIGARPARPKKRCAKPAVGPSLSSPRLTVVPGLEKSAKEAEIIRETVALLHASEAVAMVEYIEAVVPIIYAIYIAILFHLPNARYYQDMAGFTEEKLKVVVMNILAYGVMEMLSLLHVQRRINRQFGVSVFYQLAFALENEWQIYQCCFLSWIIVVFQFLLGLAGVGQHQNLWL